MPIQPGILTGKPSRDTALPIVRPTFPPLSSFADDFDRALKTGAVTNHGPHVQAFEDELGRYVGAPTLAFASGQAALMAMLAASGVAGGEVIVPAFTFCATPHAVAWAGAKPVFADIDPRTLTIDAEACDRLIGPKTVAILGVCVYGIACDYRRLAAVAARRGVLLLFDSAPAFGTHVGGRPIGGFGTAQSFSFHATKALATMEGGALSSFDKDLLARAAALRNFGQRGGAAWGGPGFNGKMTEIAAIIGRRQLTGIEAIRRHRTAVADAYRQGLSSIPGIAMAEPPDEQEPIWLYFPIRIDAAVFGLDRDQLCAALVHDNIFCRKYFDQLCHQLPAYLNGEERRLPVSEAWADNCIALPVYNDQSDEEVGYIVERIAAIRSFSELVRQRLSIDDRGR